MSPEYIFYLYYDSGTLHRHKYISDINRENNDITISMRFNDSMIFDTWVDAWNTRSYILSVGRLRDNISVKKMLLAEYLIKIL
jgi:hypothetical protein